MRNLLFFAFIVTTPIAILGQNPDTTASPIPMYIEDKTFIAGDEVTLDVWSDDILSLIAWQFRLEFSNAEIIDITSGNLFENVGHNIINNSKTINTLWFAEDGQSFDIQSNQTWFTLTIIPEVDGSTFDLFTTENDPWSEMTIDDDINFSSFDVDFSFHIEERNFLVSNSNVLKSDLILHNNPVGDMLTISGIDDALSNGLISIYSLEGKLVKNATLDNRSTRINLDVSQLSTGLYVLHLNSGNTTQNLKFYKM